MVADPGGGLQAYMGRLPVTRTCPRAHHLPCYLEPADGFVQQMTNAFAKVSEGYKGLMD